MSNTLLNPSIIAQETLLQLENRKNIMQNVFRGYEKEWMTRSNGWKKGATITAKAPLYFRVKDGETIDVVDLREEDVSMVVEHRKHVAYKLTGTEMTLNIDEFSDRFLKPVVDTFEDHMATTLLGAYKYIPAQVGTPGMTPSAVYTIGEASAVLTDQSAPKNDRYCYLDPWATIKIADQMKGLLHAGMVSKAVKEGSFGNLVGFNMYETQNINTHTCGTAAGVTDIDVDGASSEGDTTITVDQGGSWAKTFTQGDIFTVASVNGVNTISGGSTGRARQFVVEAAAGTTGTETALSCTPGVAPYQIYSASATEKTLPYQTVDALPANDAAVTVAGSASLAHKVNMAFHKDAIALFMVPVQAPSELKSYNKSANGFTITVAIGGDIVNYVSYIRFDILYGYKVINPFLGCRIAG